ncbi:MAG: PAS domain S-box protein [Candidatus Hermodarchaeota archaeon]
MLDESILNLQITLFFICGTIIFIIVSFKRKDFYIYLPPYILVPLGYFFVYLQTVNYVYRLLGNAIFLIAMMSLIAAIFYEYFKVIGNKKKGNLILNFTPIMLIVVGIQIIFTILLFIALIMLIKLYFIEKTTKRASLIIFIASALLSAIATILSNLNISGMWEFSFVTTFVLCTCYFIFPIFLMLEEKLVTVGARLVHSEEKFRTIAEESQLAIVILQDDVIKYANERLAELSEFSLDEILNWAPQEFLIKVIAPDSVEMVMEQTKKKQRGDPDIMIQYPVHLKKKSGELYWADDISKTIMYEGRPADLISLIDITDKVQAVRELKESEEKFRTITEQSFIGVVIEQNYDIKYVNHQFSTILGYSSEELLSWRLPDFYEIVHPDDVDRFKKLIEDKGNGLFDSITNFQFRLFKKTGELLWLELFSRVILYKDGSANLAFIMDITEKREAEQKIRESEEKFRTITEQSFMGIIIIQDGFLKYINEGLSKITEYSLQEMSKWSSEEYFFKHVYPDDVLIAMERFHKMEIEEMGTLGSYPYRIFTKSQKIKWIDVNSKVIQYQGKNAILATLVDVTSKKEAEQLILEENKRLLELHNLRKDLITRISHELKTPLTSMYGSSQIMLRFNRNGKIEDIWSFIQIFHRGCIRLKELVDNLLDIAKLENKKLELKLSDENINSIIDACVEELKYIADNRRLTISVKLPHNVYYKLDRSRFEQVLINIISNAIKNTPPRGNIYISLNETDKYIDIIVKDSGVGITVKENELLFQKFGKIERYGMDLDVDIEGAGLGLYISKEIVELHGGRIFMESEGRNKGSTFTVRLNKKVIM